ncbi:MAG TPA: hypothetical protein DIU45_12035 [Clostridium sp.]|nr:hypothetical protein [Clostridium sp.]
MISNTNISTNRKNKLDAFREVEELLNKRKYKGFFRINSENKTLSPDIDSIVYLRHKNNRIEKFNVAFTIEHEKAIRIYEVELLLEGKPVDYLYKQSVINIIMNKIKESLYMIQLNPQYSDSIIKAYIGAIENVNHNN